MASEQPPNGWPLDPGPPDTDAEIYALADAVVTAVGIMSRDRAAAWLVALVPDPDRWPQLCLVLATMVDPPAEPAQALADAYRATIKERYPSGSR
jgi:hypothetical protein